MNEWWWCVCHGAVLKLISHNGLKSSMRMNVLHEKCKICHTKLNTFLLYTEKKNVHQCWLNESEFWLVAWSLHHIVKINQQFIYFPYSILRLADPKVFPFYMVMGAQHTGAVFGSFDRKHFKEMKRWRLIFGLCHIVAVIVNKLFITHFYLLPVAVSFQVELKETGPHRPTPFFLWILFCFIFILCCWIAFIPHLFFICQRWKNKSVHFLFSLNVLCLDSLRSTTQILTHAHTNWLSLLQ